MSLLREFVQKLVLCSASKEKLLIALVTYKCNWSHIKEEKELQVGFVARKGKDKKEK